MPFKPVLLTTDVLLFALLGSVTAYALYARGKAHLRTPWSQVVQSRLGMVGAVVLSAYAVVAVVDSVHLRMRLPSRGDDTVVHYAPDVVSLLDLWAGHLRNSSEKTYSAPFATHLYVKETVVKPDGAVVQVYPRLKHAGVHLRDPVRDRAPDIVASTARSLGVALLVWLALFAGVVHMLARGSDRPFRVALAQVLQGGYRVPWRTLLGSLGLVLAVTVCLASLSADYHVFGTDKVGQDVFYQTLKSIRTGLLIGTLTTLVMLPFAVVLGIMAGYFGRWVDDLIQYTYTTLSSIPGVLLIAASILSLQVYLANHPQRFTSFAESSDLRLLFLCLILGVTSWTSLCRLLRAETLKLRELDYVEAATALGVHHGRIISRHILPNVMHVVFITVALDFSGLVLAEAVLSYVGVGVDPSMNSWGNMINQARLEMARDPVVWWSLLAALVFMFTIVLAANLFSDAVRDAFDPRLRTSHAE